MAKTNESSRPPWAPVAAVAVIALLAFAGGAFVAVAATDEDTPTTSSVDAGFARDMREHAAQGVQMSLLVRDNGAGPAVRALALDILLAQQQQRGEMAGWLSTWGLDPSGGQRMVWMSGGPRPGKGTMDNDARDHEPLTGASTPPDPEAPGPMPGAATPAQLQALQDARGVRAERIYLQLMIPHHQAGLTMAKYAAANAEQPQVRRLAQTIVDQQTADLTVLQDLLDARGGPVTLS